MTTKLFDKIYGWLLGGGIGDAMGAPVEDMHYLDIREQFGEINTFVENLPRVYGGRPPYETSIVHWHERRLAPQDEPHPLGQFKLEPGVYTDDTRYKLLICKSIIKRGRMVTGPELAEDLYDYTIDQHLKPDNDLEALFANAMFNVKALVTMHTQRPFAGNHSGGGIWGGAVGVISPGSPFWAGLDGGFVAAIVAAAMTSDATVDSVIQAAYDYAEFVPGRRYTADKIRDVDGYSPSGYDYPTPDERFKRRLDMALEDAEKSSDMNELTERLHKWILIAYPAPRHGVHFEFIPVALAMFYKAKGDPRETIIGCVNFGRDNDSIASFAGEVAGALQGASSIPEDWVRVFVEVNDDLDLAKTTRQLEEIILQDADKMVKRAEDIKKMAV